jgi:hypothetical protein
MGVSQELFTQAGLNRYPPALSSQVAKMTGVSQGRPAENKVFP